MRCRPSLKLFPLTAMTAVQDTSPTCWALEDAMLKWAYSNWLDEAKPSNLAEVPRPARETPSSYLLRRSRDVSLRFDLLV